MEFTVATDREHPAGRNRNVPTPAGILIRDVAVGLAVQLPAAAGRLYLGEALSSAAVTLPGGQRRIPAVIPHLVVEVDMTAPPESLPDVVMDGPCRWPALAAVVVDLPMLTPTEVVELASRTLPWWSWVWIVTRRPWWIEDAINRTGARSWRMGMIDHRRAVDPLIPFHLSMESRYPLLRGW